MTRTVATIRIHNLRLRTFIGFNPEERVKKQDIVINAEVAYTLPDGVFEDRVEDALNYKTITKAIIELVENGQFLLLEKLVGDVLKLCTADSSVQRASVTIEKPHALRFADSVSLTLNYPAERVATPHLLEKAS
ncbi:MAG: dihydroneopterin triphosphate 2'-epimerase [Pseudomonadota bacterium]